MLLCSILNLSHFSSYKDTLVLSLLVCISSLLSLLFLVDSCIFFFVFVLTRSALCIFILFNDYFLCSKAIICAYCLADVSILFINKYIF